MKPKALGSYIFAGAFTVGVRKHFDVVAHLEGDRYGTASARLNFPKLPIHVGIENWPLRELRREKIRFIYGNPPCAAWSALNGKKTVQLQTWKTDARVSCTRAHFSLIEALRPDVWCWESVDRAYTAGREFVDELTRRALDLGYAVTHLLVDAQYLDTPHRRRRFFMVVHRIAIPWQVPAFNGVIVAKKILSKKHKSLPSDNSIRPLPEKYRAAYRATPLGHPIQSAWDKINPEHRRKRRIFSTGGSCIIGRPSFRHIRVDPDEVLPTMVGANLLHWKEPRWLTIAEMRAVGGYPPNFKIQEGWQADLLTRAVMPPVGAWVARHVAAALRQNKKIKPGVHRVDFRKEPGIIETLDYT